MNQKTRLLSSVSALAVGRIMHGDGDGGGDSGGGDQLKADDPRIKALIDAAVADQTKGLKANRDQVFKDREELQNQLAALTEKLGGEEGIKQTVEMRQKFMADETNKLLVEGKYEEWFDKRTGALKADHSKHLSAKDQKISDLESEVEKLKSNIQQREVGLAIDKACREVGADPAYYDAIALLVQRTIKFDQDTSGLLVVDDKGEPRFGKGAQPMTVLEAVDELRNTKPALFLKSFGGGAGGGKTSGGYGKPNPFSKSAFNLTEQGRLYRENPDLYARLKVEAAAGQ